MTSPSASPVRRSGGLSNCESKVHRAMRVADFNGWTFAVFCGASLCLLPFQPTVAGVLITLMLGIVARNEFRGQKLLAQLDVAGCRLLGWNQLLLLAAIIGYCAWSIVWGFWYPSPFSEVLDAPTGLIAHVLDGMSDADRRDTVDALRFLAVDCWSMIMLITYGAVAIVSIVYQGGNAWYNFTRARYVRQCRQEASAVRQASAK